MPPPLHHGDEQVFLRTEVEVHHGLGNPHGIRDLVNGRPVVALPRENPRGGIEHLLFAHRSGTRLGLRHACQRNLPMRNVTDE